MRESFRKLDLPGISYGESKLDYSLKREEYFLDIGISEMSDSDVETHLDNLVNNDNSRIWIGMKRDNNFMFRYNVLTQELKVRKNM